MNHHVSSHTFALRPMREDDTPALADLHKRAILAAYFPHYAPEAVRDWANSRSPARYLNAQARGERFLVYERDGQPVGFVSWHADELCAMYVDPAYQKQHIGEILTRAAMAQALHDGQPLTWVKAALPARGFYEKMGFTFKTFGTSTVQGHTLEDVLLEYPLP